MTPTRFDSPIYVTRPMLGPLDDYLPHLQQIWDSHILTNSGPKHQQLEAEIAKTLKVKHAKLFNNGTLALITAFKALGVTGEVIVTPFTFPATVHALAWAGLTPVFCDIDPVTMCIDPKKIEALITPNTSAILAVHVYGIPCDVHSIQRIAEQHKLIVVYDAAHAFNTTVDGKGIGSFGDITMFSFHATKLFHTFEGGALTFADPALAEKIDLFKNFGIYDENDITIIGGNAKMNEFQAAVGLVNLGLIDGEYEKRRAVRATYEQVLSGIPGIRVVEVPKHASNSLQYFVVRVGAECPITRRELHEALKEYNVYSRQYFSPLCCDFGCYSALPSSHITVARVVAEEVLCLPFYGDLSLESVQRIGAMIHHLVAHAKARPVAVRA